ncbi:hypothetical protein BC829DRAFT_394632, partial [Chytridium lagenaria]
VPGAVILQTFGFNAKDLAGCSAARHHVFSFLTIGFLWLQFMVASVVENPLFFLFVAILLLLLIFFFLICIHSVS